MTQHPDDSAAGGTEHDSEQDSQHDGGATGIEISMTDGEGSTFEPEEDPEAVDDQGEERRE
jgi:hypothetical protein